MECQGVVACLIGRCVRSVALRSLRCVRCAGCNLCFTWRHVVSWWHLHSAAACLDTAPRIVAVWWDSAPDAGTKRWKQLGLTVIGRNRSMALLYIPGMQNSLFHHQLVVQRKGKRKKVLKRRNYKRNYTRTESDAENPTCQTNTAKSYVVSSRPDKSFITNSLHARYMNNAKVFKDLLEKPYKTSKVYFLPFSKFFIPRAI